MEFSSTSLVLHWSLTSPRAIPGESGTVLLFASISSLTLKKYDFLPVQHGILASSPGWKLRGSLSRRPGAGTPGSVSASGSGAQHASRQEGLLPYPGPSPSLAAPLTTQTLPGIRDCPWEWTRLQGQGWVGRNVSATVGLIQALNCQEAAEIGGKGVGTGGLPILYAPWLCPLTLPQASRVAGQPARTCLESVRAPESFPAPLSDPLYFAHPLGSQNLILEPENTSPSGPKGSQMFSS